MLTYPSIITKFLCVCMCMSVSVHMHAQLFSCVWLFVTQGLYPARLLYSWNFSGKNTGVACLLQVIFPTQRLNPLLLDLLHGQADSLPMCHLGSPNSSVAAAKSLQSCTTLCNPIDGSPPGSPVLGIQIPLY